VNIFQQARTQLGLTQTQMAEKLDVPVNTLRNWEQGKSEIGERQIGLLLPFGGVEYTKTGGGVFRIKRPGPEN
jgi:transcriptional regulator with XRE-family HTH domain